MLGEQNATVLPFRDAALRRPIDVVAWMNTRAPSGRESIEKRDNVIPMAIFARAAHRTWLGGPPEGEAA